MLQLFKCLNVSQSKIKQSYKLHSEKLYFIGKTIFLFCYSIFQSLIKFLQKVVQKLLVEIFKVKLNLYPKIMNDFFDIAECT